jgi:hypothetical protein
MIGGQEKTEKMLDLEVELDQPQGDVPSTKVKTTLK